MSLYLTNGNHYIGQLETGKIFKTEDIKAACQFQTFKEANAVRKLAPGKTAAYHIYDDVTGERFKRKGRRLYSGEDRRHIYTIADGRCQLCGRPITYEEMTLDHIVPLAMKGKDAVENLQCSCSTCNTFKGSILPEDFFDRITQIFLFQIHT